MTADSLGQDPAKVAYIGHEVEAHSDEVPDSISIVIPVFNENAGLEILVQELVSALETQDFQWTVLFVDDGSTDGSLVKLKRIHAGDCRFKAISLSRNFGKEIAIAAGLRYSRADAVVLMDADLQHPPSLIPSLMERWRSGYKVVFAQRESRDRDSTLRRICSLAFYAIYQRIAHTRLPEGIGDFVLLDRTAVDAINRLDERTRFSKGLYSWIGFPSTAVKFTVHDRLIGTSRWNFLKLVRFAFDGLISFSNLPLKVWSFIGALISLAALAYAVYIAIRTMIFDADVPGFPSLIVSIMFFSGVQLISLGIIGEYLARVFEEVKGRPLYIVSEEVGISGDATETNLPDNLQRLAAKGGR